MSAFPDDDPPKATFSVRNPALFHHLFTSDKTSADVPIDSWMQNLEIEYRLSI